MPTDPNIKEKLLAKCIELKEESESHLLTDMKEAEKSANEYGPARDRYDSFRPQLMRKRNMLAKQLSAIDEELRFLRQMKFENKYSTAESGAIVVLQSQTIFILLGIGKIDMDNKPYYVISPVVPLATAMKNSKAGDSFSFRGKKMKIIEIF